MKKELIILLLFMFSTLPSIAGMKSTMDKLMESWAGENIDSVITLWGNPTETKTSDNGKIYYWSNSRDIIAPGFGIYGGTYGGTSTCNKSFGVDENNIIINWNWSGNACPMTYRGAKKYLNSKNNYQENR